MVGTGIEAYVVRENKDTADDRGGIFLPRGSHARGFDPDAQLLRPLR